ncbi:MULTISPECIES: hypothetical protein [unclassified Brenneria]|uniref:hypothetical protein n=1 Tax=unclassified Brenneria TaxID=2634434 RepID=UPI0029C2B1A7|nr:MULTISPECIES: hypothetical protein [unclassified Brenneria]MDX5628069.1 hypothetical protein [Brenneria sp. L3-3Z]MDX5694911.1 hypothetical protein [Brenneria sp. L4-2C]MEE3660700.1 hypothetical protein [Brenneria sp. g21c3]
MMNPVHNRYFSGESTVDPLADIRQESVVKLHDVVSADYLGITRFTGKNIRVDASTMENLKLAQETLRKVKRMLPYGAGNQKADVIYTKGESAMRLLMLRERAASPFPVVNAKEVARHQAGNCGEQAELSYTLLAGQRVNAPVQYVSDKNWDHEYVLIGDPRDQFWGDQHTVVVDPWVRFPTAVTLAQAHNRNPDFPALYQIARNADPLPGSQALHHIKHVTSAEVSQFMQEEGIPPIGVELLDWINDSGETQHMFDEKNVAKDPSTRYSSNFFNAVSMDEIASATVDRQKAAQREWQESGYDW